MEKVTEAQRTGGADKGEALLAEVFKLLGNSEYRKLIEALERQTCVVYTKDEKVVDKALTSERRKKGLLQRSGKAWPSLSAAKQETSVHN